MSTPWRSTRVEAKKDGGDKGKNKDAKEGKEGKEKKEKVYPEERKVEVGGVFYRRCAAALVFNAKGEVLVGERSDRPGSWNMPQGGIEIDESTVEAASRELYEEVGMKVGETRGLAVVGDIPPHDDFCYAAGGWLAKKGLAGQRLEFCLFHLPTADDPTPYCNLNGLEGEKAEFTQVAWMSFDALIDTVWESKRAPYIKCKELAAPMIERHLKAVSSAASAVV
eukprot:CAMPEP_0197605804 /NCGR_PEP_ID=MMETSP1326-20131121/43810_1 /TAXON_ID=1155430 /ORGANISM="Genus nov. species nov., Strain RCC2288" /LENGTH=222 /DNA_ID=CAMNT_0043173649 /DNA_START=54 /DNA_END=722 /DNA_ORIENTATION=+